MRIFWNSVTDLTLLFQGKVSSRETSHGISASFSKNGFDPVSINTDIDFKAPSILVRL